MKQNERNSEEIQPMKSRTKVNNFRSRKDKKKVMGLITATESMKIKELKLNNCETSLQKTIQMPQIQKLNYSTLINKAILIDIYLMR